MPGNEKKYRPSESAERAPEGLSTTKRGFLKLAGGAACAACAAALGARHLVSAETGEANGEEREAKQPKTGKEKAAGAPSPTKAEPEGAVKGLLGPKRSDLFTSLGDDRVRCDLCPNACEIDEGERGTCRVRENRGGDLYTLVHGNPALLQIDPIERKPFFHVLPGSRAVSLSTAGCNMACKFCQVWDMALVDPEDVYAYEFPPERVVAQAKENDLRAVAYTLGEPVIFYEYMLETARKVREAGLKNLLHTNGFINPEPLDELIPLIDAANIDLKSFDPDFYERVCEGNLEPVKRSLLALKEAGVHIEITNILIPTLNDDMERITEMSRWIASEIGPSTPLHFVRFYPLYELANLPPTPVSTIDSARGAAKEAGLEHVYVSNAPGHQGENTFCPSCEEMIIRRMGFMVEYVRLDDGKCESCGHEIGGVWSA